METSPACGFKVRNVIGGGEQEWAGLVWSLLLLPSVRVVSTNFPIFLALLITSGRVGID
jgi:hypothetical protein